jgi:uncharacterized protein YacL
MIKNIFRTGIAVVGFFIGYAFFVLLRTIALSAKIVDADFVHTFQRYGGGWIIAIIFAIAFFLLTPFARRQGAKVAKNIDKELKGVPTENIIGTAIGLVAGLLIAYLVSRIWVSFENGYLEFAVTVLTFVVFGFIGISLGSRRAKDLPHILHKGRPMEINVGGKNAIPKILDTSVIIDGRILDIMKAGFIEGKIIIPEFVLTELQAIADSADSLRRTKGRKGLDVLKQIKDSFGIEIYANKHRKEIDEIPEVDIKLIKLSEILNAKLVTNDYNLNKVASIRGVTVLNINELSDLLRPVFIVGEKVMVHPIKEGENPGQSVAYLDDGTMIVVQNGKQYIGKDVSVAVTSTHQTSAGRMIFAKVE